MVHKTSRAAIDDFLAQKRLAVVGCSRSGKKFGNVIFKELRSKGYELTPIHPEAEAIQGVPCATSLAELSAPVDGVVVVVPPKQTVQVVKDAAAASIKRVWMQQGAESPEAIDFCKENGLSAVHHHCVLMFADPAPFPHGFHRWLKKTFGTLPQ
jgi:hypothetical protein